MPVAKSETCFPVMPSRLCYLLLAATFLTFSHHSAAQVPLLTKKATTSPSPKADAPVDTEDRLKKALADTRNALAKLNDADAEVHLPEGITPAALADRRQDLDQLARTLSRHISQLEAVGQAESDLTSARAASASWGGFDEKPPYSILLIDDLANRQELLNAKKESFQSSISLFQRTLDGIERELPIAEAEKNKTLDVLSQTETATPAAKWQADAAAAKYQLLFSRAEAIQSNLQLLKTQLATSTTQGNLLAKQLRTARSNSQFNDADYQKLLKIASDRQAAIHKLVIAAENKKPDAQNAKNRARINLDKLVAASPDNPSTPEIETARLTLTAADMKLDVLQMTSETLTGLEGIESYPAVAYKNRRTLSEASSKAERDAAMQSLISIRDRLNAWEVVSSNELAAVTSDLGQLSNTAAAIPTDDLRARPLADQREALWDRQTILQRANQSTGSLRKNFDRWINDYSKGQTKSVGAWVTDSFSDSWALVTKVWQFNVAHYDVSTFDGGTITKGVQLGTVIKALLFFGIAYYIAARVSRRLQGILIRRVHIGEAQASTMRNWVMILVGVGLAIATLNFLSIPLTVFAFFGGALAIGLGFGTQTLIKNFISGIIVLFERKIRVGDIIDVGGLSGTIAEINTRSSVLRGADGKETLVPNSVFLENRITNLTLTNRRVRKLLPIRVEYGTLPQKVMPILTDCVERHGLVLKEPAPVVTLEEFADAGLIFGIYYWTEFNSKTNGDVVASDIRIMIDKRFAEAGIKMPTPTRDFPIKTVSPLQFTLIKPPSETDEPAE